MRYASALLCVFVGFGNTAGAEQPLACELSHVPKKFRLQVEDLATGRLPLPDYIDTIRACQIEQNPFMPAAPVAAPAQPTSVWLEAERERYAGALAKQRADVLVVPFQVQGYGLDRVERALMTADLAYAIGGGGSYAVADPFLTALALGEGNRRIDSVAVQRLAERIGARKIVTGYVGHDGKHAFTLTLQVRDAASSTDPWQRDWRAVAFTDDRTPAYVWHDMLPRVLQDLPLGLVSAAPRAPPQTEAVAPRVTTSPIELIASSSSPRSAIATTSLLAALLPAAAERHRERLLERALLIMLRTETDEADRFLEGYALLGLRRRPTALARIDGADGASFDALRALLNGNLPAAQQATARSVTNPLEQLLLQIAVRDLEYRYGKDTQTPPSALQRVFDAEVAADWAPLLEARLQAEDPWFSADALAIKRALDEAFPAIAYSADAVIAAGGILRRAPPDAVDFDLATARHARQVAGRLDATGCCSSSSLRSADWDLLWTLEGIAEARMDRVLEIEVLRRGADRRTLELLARYEPLFEGHPDLTAWRALAAVRISLKGPDDERESWLARGRRDALAALLWAQGQNRTGLTAATALGIPSPDNRMELDAYGHDYPRRADWPFDFIGSGDDVGAAQMRTLVTEAMAFTTDNLEPLQWLPRGISAEERERVVGPMAARFAGHPAAGGNQLAGKAPEERVAALRAEALSDPAQNLGLGYQIVLSGGDLAEAQAAFLAYPSFQTGRAANAAALSNQAYEVGSLFFWQGRPQLAEPFFTIAARLGTRSEAEMASVQRLLMLAGDYEAASEAALSRASRYGSAFAYRDSLSFLHAFGRHKAASGGFMGIRASLDDPQAWLAELVGHRMQAQDERAMRAWLETPDIRDSRFRAQRFASYYALIASTTDRVPPEDLGAFIERLEGPPVARMDSDGNDVLRPHSVSPNGVEIVRRTFTPPGERVRQPGNSPVKSERAFFADAYTAVARGDYASAVQKFAAMAGLYPIHGAAIPYFAYAAAKTGDPLGFETWVGALDPNDYGDFDTLLSRAFFAAGRNDLDAALATLRRALRNKPMSGERAVIPEFQYAQACEWLYRDTRDPRFAAELLEWARNHQVIVPTAAWAYSMQYAYETEPDARTRALALTRYLDPKSERIQRASSAEVARADAWLAANNPFDLARQRQSGQAATAWAR